MGVRIAKNIATNLSTGKVATGRMQVNIQGAKKSTTTVKWEAHVERALLCPLEPWNFREFRMTMQEMRSRKQMSKHMPPVLAATTIPSVQVWLQDSFNSEKKLHIKWSIRFEPQKVKSMVKRICTVACRIPPIQTTSTKNWQSPCRMTVVQRRGLQMATQRSQDMTVRTMVSDAPRKCSIKS